MASLYQKYRAKNFDEIVGHDLVKNILIEALKTNRISHSYIFFGTRGAGKTSISRIFARALNCQSRIDNYNPCNSCESCKASLFGNHPDIIEMDAASNRGIDDARSLKESILNLPSLGKYKVYIIDEAHMMTKEAFNALLKTIEEPPEHVVFIFCTTEVRKVPVTIISRSQVFTLRNATIAELKDKVNYILKSENISMDEESIELICKLGNGSYRDTESLLEKVLLQADGQVIDINITRNILGIPDSEIIYIIYKYIHGQADFDIDQLISYIALYDAEILIEMIVNFVLDKIRDKTFFENDISTSIELINFVNEIKNFNKPEIALAFKLTEIRNRNTNTSFSDEIVSKSVKNKANQTLQTESVSKRPESKDVTIPSNELEQKTKKHDEKINLHDDVNDEGAKRDLISEIKQKVQTKNKFLYKILESSLDDIEIIDNKIIFLIKDTKALSILSSPNSKNLLHECINDVNKTIEIRLITENDKSVVIRTVENLTEHEISEVFDIE
ncbi:MAG: DNA polymerase III subunit gamma/tau [Candidatus Dojkabacteria bacterium]|nr:DNA polymerase III subunit gamma/tau [Candidatus Dojkabacteria bacterium]